MTTNKKLIVLLLTTALFSSTAFYLFPEAKKLGVTNALAFAFAAGSTQLVAVWYFLSSARAFKRGLEIAYYLLSAGILAFSFSQFVLPLFIFVTITNVMVANLLIIVPYALGGVVMYLGMYRFAKLLGVHYLWGSFLFVLAFSLPIAGVFVILPHADIGVSEATFDLIFGTAAWAGAFVIATTILAIRIRRAIGPLYKAATSWFAIGLAALALAIYHEVLIKMYLNSSWYVGSVSIWPFVLVGVLFLKAGLDFKEAGHQFIQLPAGASYVEVVVSTARMISNASAIDTALDKVRAITATQSYGQELSPTDKATLLDVYLYIEDYLVTKEPLSTFTTERLRAGLPPDFLSALNVHTSRSASGS